MLRLSSVGVWATPGPHQAEKWRDSMRTGAKRAQRRTPKTSCLRAFQPETPVQQTFAEPPEPSSQGGSVGSNPIGATNRNPLRRKGFCAFRAWNLKCPIRAWDMPGTQEDHRIPGWRLTCREPYVQCTYVGIECDMTAEQRDNRWNFRVKAKSVALVREAATLL